MTMPSTRAHVSQTKEVLLSWVISGSTSGAGPCPTQLPAALPLPLVAWMLH